jgi:hypothetical protein
MTFGLPQTTVWGGSAALAQLEQALADELAAGKSDADPAVQKLKDRIMSVVKWDAIKSRASTATPLAAQASYGPPTWAWYIPLALVVGAAAIGIYVYSRPL